MGMRLRGWTHFHGDVYKRQVDYRLDSEFTTAPLQKGDILLLCSDGLTNAVPREQLEQLLRTRCV